MQDQQTIIFLIRHGETDFAYVNDQSIDDNRVLTSNGKEQCRKNGEYLKDFSLSTIYSSPMKRTVETSEIIKKHAEIDADVVVEQELHEIYDNASWQSIGTRIPELFLKFVGKHSGEQIACVSHMDVIENTLRAIGATNEEADFPCQIGQMYRLVFAGKTFVQVTKLDPSK